MIATTLEPPTEKQAKSMTLGRKEVVGKYPDHQVSPLAQRAGQSASSPRQDPVAKHGKAESKTVTCTFRTFKNWLWHFNTLTAGTILLHRSKLHCSLTCVKNDGNRYTSVVFKLVHCYSSELLVYTECI